MFVSVDNAIETPLSWTSCRPCETANSRGSCRLWNESVVLKLVGKSPHAVFPPLPSTAAARKEAIDSDPFVRAAIWAIGGREIGAGEF